jgi:hypothetical protein
MACFFVFCLSHKYAAVWGLRSVKKNGFRFSNTREMRIVCLPHSILAAKFLLLRLNDCFVGIRQESSLKRERKV